MRGRNKTIVAKAIEEYLIGHGEEVLRSLFSPDCVAAGPDVGGSNDGIPIPLDCVAFRDHSLMYKSAFPDMEFKVEEIIEEGDRVAARWTVRGGDCGNSEAIALRRQLAADGGDFTASGVAFCRMKDGKIIEIWQVSEMVTLARCLLSPRDNEAEVI